MTQAEKLIARMEQIWGDDPDNKYDAWHNANIYAIYSGAKKVGYTVFDNEIHNIWQFADRSAVEINKNGSSISEVTPDSAAARLLP